jgi:hypothetical protein
MFSKKSDLADTNKDFKDINPIVFLNVHFQKNKQNPPVYTFINLFN